MLHFLEQDAFEDFNQQISHRFTPQTYDLLKHNCNNYTNEAAKFLLDKGIPECERAGKKVATLVKSHITAGNRTMS